MQINANWLLLSCKGIQKHNVPKYIASLFQSHSKQTDNSFHWMHCFYTKAIHLWKRPGLPEGSVVLIHDTINAGRYSGGRKVVTNHSLMCVAQANTHYKSCKSCHLVTLCHELEDGRQQMPSPHCLKRNKGTTVSTEPKIKAKCECKFSPNKVLLNDINCQSFFVVKCWFILCFKMHWGP